MVKVVTTQSVTFTTPVLDSKGKPLTQKVKFKKREIDSPVVDHHRHKAGVLVDVEKDHAAELIAKGLARMPDATLDDEPVDPTKSSTDPLA